MGTRKITCNTCQTQFLSTSAPTYRCHKCRNPIFSNTKRSSIDHNTNDHLQQRQQEASSNDHLSLSYHIFPPKRNYDLSTTSKCLKMNKVPSQSYASLNSNNITQVCSSNTGGRISRKRALLCGVSYCSNRKYKLKGTVNDVKNMRELLMSRFHYPADSIRVLTEHETDKCYTPTKQNIENWLKWLVEDCKSGDSLVFYFSGHGLRQPDFEDDEIDGFDETICPLDFIEKGMIRDNDINNIIVKPLKNGVTLHAIVDACHSGTILDLLHVYDLQTHRWIPNYPPSGASKSTSGGLAICLSACADDKLAADTTAFSKESMNGAMTYIFTQTVKEHTPITYGKLLEGMSKFVKKSNKERFLHVRILQKIFHRKLLQEPLLSSSERFDVNEKIFKL